MRILKKAKVQVDCAPLHTLAFVLGIGD